jgi:hypothetical protein
MFTLLRQKVFKEFGDQGADTLDRYTTQIECSASLCIRMLNAKEGIGWVIPEGGDDVVVVRSGVYELHQVKTKDESQGTWTTAEVLPILCGQYDRRKIYPTSGCNFHGSVAGIELQLQFLLQFIYHSPGILLVKQNKSLLNGGTMSQPSFFCACAGIAGLNSLTVTLKSRRELEE